MVEERPVIEIYASIECPYAYLMAYRLRQVWNEYRDNIRFVWRALSLEYINKQIYPLPLVEAEYSLFQKIEPTLPWRPWQRREWEWPTTYIPAFEALICAQAQSDEAAFEMSWALRHAYFANNHCLSMRYEILAVAEEVAVQYPLDLQRFQEDLDHGRYKAQVLAESRRGWHDLKVEGSATMILPDERRYTNPAIGDINFDEDHYQLRGFIPFNGDPLDEYRQILSSITDGAKK